MERVLFAEHFEIDASFFCVETPTRTTATQCDRNHEEVTSFNRFSQTDDFFSSSEQKYSQKSAAQVSDSDNKIEMELDNLLSKTIGVCKNQMKIKAELAAKIKHTDWLRKGQTIEDAIQEYFKGSVHYQYMYIFYLYSIRIHNSTKYIIISYTDDIEIYEKAQALRMHFEHEKCKITASLNTSTTSYFKKTINNDTFDYGDEDDYFTDYYSTSCKNKNNKRSFESSSFLDNCNDKIQKKTNNFCNENDNAKKFQAVYKSRPFKSPKK